MPRLPVAAVEANVLRILVVSHDYEPMATARAMRWTSVANALCVQGHDVTIVCQGAAGSTVPVAGSPTIHRVPGGWLQRMRQRAAPALSGPSAQSGTKSILRAVYDRTWRRLYWPDYASAWRRPATKVAIGLQRARAFDVMITVSPPFTSHRIGLELHRRFPDLPWLVDLGDPFSFDHVASPNNPKLYAARNRRLEETVLDAANVLTTVNEPLRDLWAKHFPASAEKFRVVPPLVVKTLPDAVWFLPRNPARKMVFAGTLYKTAGPAPLFRLIERINDAARETWELHVLGDPWEVRDEVDAYRHLMGKQVHLHGHVPRAKAERAVLEADVLVSLGMRSEIASPSKLFHYFGTGKPVVHVPYVWPDATAPYLARYARSHVITAADALKAGPLPRDLLDLLARAKDVPTVPTWLEEHSPVSIAKKYASLLDESQRSAQRASNLV